MKVIAICCLLILPVQEKTHTEDLLSNPFDLQTFKRKKGPSNSGGADVRPYYFRPDSEGTFFRFFIFPKTNAFIYQGTESKKKSVRSGTGFQIITYKPKGKYSNDYLDPTETLIELSATYNDPDLPGLAFVGLDTLTIKRMLGNNFIRKDNCFIYSKGNNALLLKIEDGVAKCLKYTRMRVSLTEAVLAKGLTEMDCRNVPVR